MFHLPGFVLRFVCNVLIQFSILMVVGSFAFYLSEVNSIMLPVAWSVAWFYEFNRYPITIFHPALQILLTYVLPFALGAYFAVAFMLHPHDYIWVPVLVLLVTAALLGLPRLSWNRGLRSYSSANA